MNKSIKHPLVSVTVITYNSSIYVLETLESVKAQTYTNLELIISDDCSTDNTVEICRTWMNNNKNRFQNTHLINSPVNTGIPANKNRAIAICKGEWLKSIAGDDLMLPNCIEDNIQFTHEFPECNIAMSNMIICDSDKTPLRVHKLNKVPILKEPTFHQIQKKWLLLGYFGTSPSLFINQKIFKSIKYDEQFKLLEDYPFALNVVNEGYTFSYFDKTTVMYRRHDQSVNRGKSKSTLFNSFYEVRRTFEKIYIYPEISLLEKVLKNIEYNRIKSIDKLGLNKNNILCRIISYGSYRLSPIHSYKKLKFKYFIRLHQKLVANNERESSK